MLGDLIRALVVAAIVFGGLGNAFAQEQTSPAQEQTATGLAAYLDDAMLAMVFPGADSYGPVEGEPPAATAYKNGKIVGYIFEQYDVVQGVGYSKRPFHLIVGLDLAGRIAGARLTMHTEPIAILGHGGSPSYSRQRVCVNLR